MSDRASALGADFKPGQYGNLANGIGVHLSETAFGFLGELAAFPAALDKIEKLAAAASKSEVAAFKITANRWFLAGPATLADTIRAKLKQDRPT